MASKRYATVDKRICVACGACMEQCPQHIQIPDLMTEIANAYEALK